MEYLIRRTSVRPELTGDWDGPVWSLANTGELAQGLPGRIFDHHPRVQFRLLYDESALYLIFRVEDQFVRCVTTEFNGPVCTDSCTEFFVQPKPEKGYINFEVNCGGTLLAYYIEDATIVNGDFAKRTALTHDDVALLSIYHSLPQTVDPEITSPITWVNEVHIPFTLFERYIGPLDAVAGTTWKANLYKCGDRTSHPHWLTWALVNGPNFHQPQCFAPIRFEESII